MKSILFLLLIFIFPQSYAETLRIGTTNSFPPFSYAASNSGNLFGFDVELIEEICKRLKASCKFVTMPYNDMFMALEKEEIDLAVSAIIITSDMTEDFIFSIPYLKSYGRFLTMKSSDINTTAEIPNKRIGARKDTPFHHTARSLFNDQADIKIYSRLFDLLEALKGNDVDVILINDEAAEYWHANGGNTYKLIGSEIPMALS